MRDAITPASQTDAAAPRSCTTARLTAPKGSPPRTTSDSRGLPSAARSSTGEFGDWFAFSAPRPPHAESPTKAKRNGAWSRTRSVYHGSACLWRSRREGSPVEQRFEAALDLVLLRIDGLDADAHPLRNLIRLEALAVVELQELAVLRRKVSDGCFDEA